MIWLWKALFFTQFVYAAVSSPPSPSPSVVPSVAPSGLPSASSDMLELLKVRDPFKRPEFVEKKEDLKSPLERFEANTFKLVAVLTGPTRMRAMVLAPDGKTYFVAEKMTLGARGGIVRKITTESIQVREKSINVLGQEENEDVEIKLPEEKRAGQIAHSDGSPKSQSEMNPPGKPNGGTPSRGIPEVNTGDAH